MVKKKKIKEPRKELDPQEAWKLAVEERKNTPQWSCHNRRPPVYDYSVGVMFNEEDKNRDDNIFEMNEPFSVSAHAGFKGKRVKDLPTVPGVEIEFYSPRGTKEVKVTGDDGKAYFSAPYTGVWRFVVPDVEIVSSFNVIGSKND